MGCAMVPKKVSEVSIYVNGTLFLPGSIIDLFQGSAARNLVFRLPCKGVDISSFFR